MRRRFSPPLCHPGGICELERFGVRRGIFHVGLPPLQLLHQPLQGNEALLQHPHLLLPRHDGLLELVHERRRSVQFPLVVALLRLHGVEQDVGGLVARAQ